MLSIITINKNNLPGLIQTLGSVKNQKHPKIEHIIIDGASNDGSMEFLATLEQEVKWISEPDQGIYHAMNKGINLAKGEFVLFLNSGDRLINQNALLEFLENSSSFDLISYGLKVVEPHKNYIKTYPKKLNFSYFLFDTLPHQATFIRRSLFKRVGLYNETLKIVADWKFFLDATCKFNALYEYRNVVLSEFKRDGISSKISNRPIIDEEKSKILRDEYKMFIDDRELTISLMKTINQLRKSKKIQLMIKLGLINKF